jgi:hydrogenase/urease accessory protein HupE
MHRGTRTFNRIVPRTAALLAFAATFLAVAAQAHEPGLSTGQFRVLHERLEAELTFARADIEGIARLDTDGDGNVSETEWAAGAARLTEIARDALEVYVDQRPIPPVATAFRRDETNNFYLTATFPVSSPKHLLVTSMLVGQMPRGHRQFVTVLDATNGVLSELLLSADHDFIELNLEKPVATTMFSEFLWLGVEHIVTGYDHLLFLFALLIVVPNFRNAALIITCFTVAHSITLGVATLNWLTFDSKYVEPLIAMTIIYVGIENLARRDKPRGRWLLTFAFGLIHGFGFASVLRELGVSSGTTGIAMPLFSFNLGVELGQIAIAAVVLPAILVLRKRPVFLQRWVPACSAIVVVAGAWWLVQRTLL